MGHQPAMWTPTITSITIPPSHLIRFTSRYRKFFDIIYNLYSSKPYWPSYLHLLQGVEKSHHIRDYGGKSVIYSQRPVPLHEHVYVWRRFPIDDRVRYHPVGLSWRRICRILCEDEGVARYYVLLEFFKRHFVAWRDGQDCLLEGSEEWQVRVGGIHINVLYWRFAEGWNTY